MPDPAHRQLAIPALVAGLLLSLATFWPGVPALLGGWLAQPALALAVSWFAGTRGQPSRHFFQQDLLAPALLWAVALAVAGVLLAWPLASLRVGASLTATLGLSAVAGGCVIGLWRTWPLWQSVERESAPAARHLHALKAGEAGAWRGLGVALVPALIIGVLLCLAWPALLPSHARLPAALAFALLSPALHWILQRTPRAAGLPVMEMRTPRPAPREEIPLVAAPTALAPLPPEPVIDRSLDGALYEAARSGRVDRALELLEQGADPRAAAPTQGRDQRALVALAAVLPDLRLLRTLIAHGVDLNQLHAGMTPLLAATRDSWHGRPDAVTTLLANGADPRIADRDGNTPLHHAARSSDPGVAALLRDAAAEIDALNKEGLTPLGVACLVGNWRLAKYLLERHARPEPPQGRAALLAAAATEEDDPAGVQLLLKHKAKLNVRGVGGRTPLHEAALAGHLEICETLLAAGAEVDARDDAQRTPWLDAARAGRGPVLDALAQAGADVNAVDDKGRNALALACAAESIAPARIARLLALGVDAQRADLEGRRAVDLAAEAGRWALVSALDPDYALPSAVAEGNGETPPDRTPASLLRDALAARKLEDLDALVKLCAPAELGALLHDPALTGDVGAVRWLLRHGAAPEVLNSQRDTPLMAALAQGAAGIPVARVLLQTGLSPSGRGGLARFMAACLADGQGEASTEVFARSLIERGVDIFAVSLAGDPPLSLALRLDWAALADDLLLRGVDRQARDARGMSPLHLAAALGREDDVRRLIAHGARPDVRAADGQTPLGVALSSGRRDLADWLDWRGWKLPTRPLRASDLPSAAMAGDADAVRRLLALGFPIDAVDAQGCTALLRAAGGGHLAAVELLLARGADARLAASSGATPLSAAVSMRQTDVVATLIASGVDLEQRLPGGVTVLMLAAALGLPDICARLLTAGADIQAGDDQGLTALHCAALFGFASTDRERLVALLDTLLLAGADPEATAAGSVTPLLLLLGARAEPGTSTNEEVILAALSHLLDEGVSLEVKDPRGFGPLHLSALHGMLHVVRRLQRAGADPDMRDALGRTPREIAVMRGFVDVASELAPPVPGTGAPLSRFLRERG
jgi:uncharacterized protein